MAMTFLRLFQLRFFPTWVLLLLATCLHISSLLAQNSATPDNFSRMYSAGSQADLLNRYGTGVSDTAAAIRRARELGIPEDQILRYLSQSSPAVTSPAPLTNSTSPTTLVVVPPAPAVPHDLVKEEPAPAKPEPVSADGAWAGLNYFGYDIFRAGKDVTTPVEVGPVDPGYLVSTGDALMLTIWGEVEYQYRLEVDQQGNILVPSVGQIFVAGTKIEDLNKRMTNYLSKFYSGLMSEPPTVFLDVTIASLRSSQVYIMGEVERPGSYTLSSYATAFNAMYVIGGPKTTGSLREVRILRDGATVAQIDLYDYLVKGLSTDDRRLMHNDILFVPPRGKTVGIRGEVNRAGVYELKENETIRDLVAFAGKLKPTAYAFRAQIERIVPANQRVRGQTDKEVVDIDLSGDVSAQQLADGDMVSIFPISNKMDNYVQLSGGGVYRPGRFELSSARTLSQLIKAADGLTPWAVKDRAEITRTYEDMTFEHIVVNLQSAMSGDSARDPALQSRDTVRVFSIHDFVDPAAVTLGGHTKKPGEYPLSDSLDLYSLLFNYAGLQDSLWRATTFMSRGDIFRLDGDGSIRKMVTFSVDDVWNRRPGTDLKLQARDQVMLYAATVRTVQTRQVALYGAVKTGGNFDWKRGMTLSDMLREGEGFRDDAQLMEAEVARVPPGGLKGDSLATILRVPMIEDESWLTDLDSAATRILRGDGPAGRFLLEPNDYVFIRSNPDFERPQTVILTGEIVTPGRYILRSRNETLRDVIKRAGGLTSESYAGGGQVIRNGQRLFANLDDLLIHGKKRENILLQPGDSIHIPQKPNMVMVRGEVMSPGYFKYLRGAGTRDYLTMSGGKTENGGRILVQQPSGRTYEFSTWKRPRPLDGAVITVYPKPVHQERPKSDWGSVIKESFAIAASAATVVVLVGQMK
jgi:protein involved in polysaccharide export with SLBB domain